MSLLEVSSAKFCVLYDYLQNKELTLYIFDIFCTLIFGHQERAVLLLQLWTLINLIYKISINTLKYFNIFSVFWYLVTRKEQFCYCSYDLCNEGSSGRIEASTLLGLVLPLLLIVNIRWHRMTTAPVKKNNQNIQEQYCNIVKEGWDWIPSSIGPTVSLGGPEADLLFILCHTNKLNKHHGANLLLLLRPAPQCSSPPPKNAFGKDHPPAPPSMKRESTDYNKRNRHERRSGLKVNFH